jgi:hypothetical protein
LRQGPLKMEVRIGKNEIDCIFDLKTDLDYYGALVDHAAHYLNLGWSLAAIDVETGENLGIDFDDENGGKYLGDAGINTSKINLGVHTGHLSRLLVLEVDNEEQKSFLDERGEWRSDCMAQLGPVSEKHFYLLPPGFQLTCPDFLGNGVKFCVDGDTTLLPPSLDPLTQERWRWQNLPWDSAPSPLPLPIFNFLHSLQEPAATGSDFPGKPVVSWQKLYCLISPCAALLQAFTNQAGSVTDYYENLFQAALEAELTDPDLLRSLLWHAPLGDARQRPDRWFYLQNLVSLAELGEAPQFPGPQREFRPGFPKGTLHNSRVEKISHRQPLSRRDRGNG